MIGGVPRRFDSPQAPVDRRLRTAPVPRMHRIVTTNLLLALVFAHVRRRCSLVTPRPCHPKVVLTPGLGLKSHETETQAHIEPLPLVRGLGSARLDVPVGGRVIFGVGGARAINRPTTRPSIFLTPAQTTKRVGGAGDFMLVRFRIAC